RARCYSQPILLSFPTRRSSDLHSWPDSQTSSCRCARVLRPARHEQRANRGDQRSTRASTRHRTRVPESRPLRRQSVAGYRRLPTATTPSFTMSPFSVQREQGKLWFNFDGLRTRCFLLLILQMIVVGKG